MAQDKPLGFGYQVAAGAIAGVSEVFKPTLQNCLKTNVCRSDLSYVRIPFPYSAYQLPRLRLTSCTQVSFGCCQDQSVSTPDVPWFMC